MRQLLSKTLLIVAMLAAQLSVSAQMRQGYVYIANCQGNLISPSADGKAVLTTPQKAARLYAKAVSGGYYELLCGNDRLTLSDKDGYTMLFSKAGGGDAADGGLAAGARPLDLDLDLLQAIRHHRLLGGVLGDQLRDVGGRLAASLVAQLAAGAPGEDVAMHVGDGDAGVVEGGVDMDDALEDLASALDLAALDFCCRRLGVLNSGILF